MKRAIIVHGTCEEDEYFNDRYPSLSNSHWLPWLQKQLLIKGIFTQTPEMPEAYQPDYEKWKNEFSRFKVDEETILIGHSCGGGFLIRWLTQNKVEVQKLILVAPWLDPQRKKTTTFFDFSIDQGIENRVREIDLFVSEDDEQDILESVKTIKKNLPNIKEYNFKNLGHFTFADMKTEKFPELLETILS